VTCANCGESVDSATRHVMGAAAKNWDKPTVSIEVVGDDVIIHGVASVTINGKRL